MLGRVRLALIVVLSGALALATGCGDNFASTVDAAVVDASADDGPDAATDARDAAEDDAGSTTGDAAVIDGPPIDGPEIDAPAVDAAAIDAPAAIDARIIDAPAAVCNLPSATISCTVGNNAPCRAVCSDAYCYDYSVLPPVCIRNCTTVNDCPSGWACNQMHRCRPPA